MRLVALLALLGPAAAGAQGFSLRPPSIGEALRHMDYMVQHAEERKAAERRAGEKSGFEQTYILPQRAGQNKVAWYDFEWEYVDVPAPGGGRGGIRLYYYRSALPQAQRALPAIQSAYARLVEQFAYQPTKRIPYFLYATQREFQATNIFQIGEGTLGVTSNQDDLRMLVPYFGDHNKFIEVSTHEMVHQFMVQKLQDAAAAEEMGSLSSVLPLWYIEGIAEYYTKGGIDVETDSYVRDLVFNSDPREGYEMIPFAEDRARGYIPTYKLGQVRIAFIAQEYGRDKIQAFIENAYLLGDGAGSAGPASRSFGALVRRVLDEPLEQVEARWRSWLKRRYYAQYLNIRQDLAQMRELRNLPLEPEDFTASADGQLVLMRGIDREKGRAKLFLLDIRNTRSAIEVGADGRPGMESLHPVEFAVGTLGPGVLAFSAQDGQGDSLYVRRFRLHEKEGRPSTIEIGKLRKLQVHAPNGPFVQIADPALSTDGSHIAFSGLVAGDAQSDVWVVPVKGGEARRVTNDPFVERDLHWGPDGIYVASDSTDHGLLNLFRVDPGTGEKIRLTTAPHTDRHPYAQADGSVLYSSDSGGKVDVHLLKGGQIRRLTDFTTPLNGPAPAPKARGLLTSTFYGGAFRIVEVPKVAFLDSPPEAVGPAAGEVLEIPRAVWPERPLEYQALSVRNWKPEAGYIYGGGTGNAVSGRAAVLFTDLMKDNVLYVDVGVYGSWDYTQGVFLYENRSNRYGLVLGGFHFVQSNYDVLDPNLAYYQRDFGIVGAVRYPLDRFRRIETELTFGAIERYCLTDFASSIVLVCQADSIGAPYGNRANWERLNGGVNFVVSPVVRFGYDTTRYDPATGPVSGSSAILELGGGWIPERSTFTSFMRADLERYWQIGTRANFSVRFAAGNSMSSSEASRVWERSYWLTSADNLRGFYPGEYYSLVGRNYYVVNAELQMPLDPLIRLFIFDYVEGVAALDFGGVFDRFETSYDALGRIVERGAWDSRTLTGVLGFNVLFGPIILRLHWGHPFDVGGLPTAALLNGDRWVTNLTLRYFFQ